MKLKNMEDCLIEGLRVSLEKVCDDNYHNKLFKDEFSEFFSFCIKRTDLIYKKYEKHIISNVLEINSLMARKTPSAVNWEEKLTLEKNCSTVDMFFKFYVERYNYENNFSKSIFTHIKSIDAKKLLNYARSSYGSVNNLSSRLSIFFNEDEAFEYLDSIFDNHISYHNYSNDFVSSAMLSCKEKNEKRLNDWIDTFYEKSKSNSYSWQKRKLAYVGFAGSGLINKKIIRRIRSESSSRVSESAISEMFTKKHLYENFNDLIANICDTNHEDVAVYLAAKLDVSMLPRLLGNTSCKVRSLVKKRISNEVN